MFKKVIKINNQLILQVIIERKMVGLLLDGAIQTMRKIQFNSMYSSFIKKCLLFLLLLFIGGIAVAQSDGSAKSKVKQAEHKKEKLAKNKQKAEIELKKRHEEIQTKATRKRMRRHRKQRIHVDAYERKEFFLKRWFHKKQH